MLLARFVSLVVIIIAGAWACFRTIPGPSTTILVQGCSYCNSSTPTFPTVTSGLTISTVPLASTSGGCVQENITCTGSCPNILLNPSADGTQFVASDCLAAIVAARAAVTTPSTTCSVMLTCNGAMNWTATAQNTEVLVLNATCTNAFTPCVVAGG